MQISLSEDRDSLTIVVHDAPSTYREALEHHYYSRSEEGHYTKRLMKPIVDIEQLKANILRESNEMLQQMAGLKPVRWEDALLEMVHRLDGQGIDWWLTGSGATAIRGIPVTPHDLDIMLHSRDLDRVQTALADCLVEPIANTGGWVVSDFGVAYLGARVDLAFDPAPGLDTPEPSDFGPYAMTHLEEVTWHGHQIKVPPLHLQLAVNRKRGRNDRVMAIEEFMQSSTYELNKP